MALGHHIGQVATSGGDAAAGAAVGPTDSATTEATSMRGMTAAGDPLVAASLPLCAEIADAFLPRSTDIVSKDQRYGSGVGQEFHLPAGGQLQRPPLWRRSQTARVLHKIANYDLIPISLKRSQRATTVRFTSEPADFCREPAGALDLAQGFRLLPLPSAMAGTEEILATSSATFSFSEAEAWWSTRGPITSVNGKTCKS